MPELHGRVAGRTDVSIVDDVSAQARLDDLRLARNPAGLTVVATN